MELLIRLLLALCLLGEIAHAQTTPKGDPREFIRLRNREFKPDEGIDPQVAEEIRKSEGRPVYLIVKLSRSLSPDQREKLQKSGVDLQDAIPERAWLTSIQGVRGLEILSGMDEFVAATPYRASDRRSPLLAGPARNLPKHAIRGKEILLVVQFFRDVKEPKERLTQAGARPLAEIPPINGWRVRVPLSAVEKLIKTDGVKWIEPIPTPPEDDNDEVRSVDGIGSINVDSGSIWNLDGSGVVVAQWESRHASTGHLDYSARITIGDTLRERYDRSLLHDESVAANAAYDNGEAVYLDVDDSTTVTAGDIRISAAGPVGSDVVNAGDPDVAAALVIFQPAEQYRDGTGGTAGFYDLVDSFYLDADGDESVSAGDTRIDPVTAEAVNFAAGTVVVAGDGDVGSALRDTGDSHDHATHVAGTLLGNGAASAGTGGTPGQWAGVAPGASLRSYDVTNLAATLNAEYVDAAANAATLSTNSWGTGSYARETAISPGGGYDAQMALYDAAISGRQSDGSASGLANPIAIFGSSGNSGVPQRYSDGNGNGQYDSGEGIYRDLFNEGTVGNQDTRILAAGGLPAGSVGAADADVGTALLDFSRQEMYQDADGDDDSRRNDAGYEVNEPVYRDNDGDRTVSVGDTRINPPAGLAAAAVAMGDADLGNSLKYFRMWSSCRIPNSSKNSIVVGNYSVDDPNKRLFPSSSRGPTDDGRLKPEVSGPGGDRFGAGNNVWSTYPRNVYGKEEGTSMSTPAVAGCGALITQFYRNAFHSAGPAPATVRALLIHGADDDTDIDGVPGSFFGPDYASGFGRVNTLKSLELIPHHILGSVPLEGDVYTKTITLGNTGELRVTLAWDDPAAASPAAASPVTGLLLNDLDLKLVAPDGRIFMPWVLDPANPGFPAAQTVHPNLAIAEDPAADPTEDHRNTVEQVVVSGAPAGDWTIRVSADLLSLPSQSFVLVSELLDPEPGASDLPAGADLWIRDNERNDPAVFPTGDFGTVPSTDRLWRSPDIWNRLAPDGLTTHENPVFGTSGGNPISNFLYIRVHNRNVTDAGVASVETWLGATSTGLSWPASFSYIGTLIAPNIEAAESERILGPLEWFPPDPAPSDHFCFYARLQSPQDPITFAEVASVSTNTANDNNIAWRNVNIVDLSAGEDDADFVVENHDEKNTKFELALEAKKEIRTFLNLTLEVPERLIDPAFLKKTKEWRVLGKTERKISRTTVEKKRETTVKDVMVFVRLEPRTPDAVFPFVLRKGARAPMRLIFRQEKLVPDRLLEQTMANLKLSPKERPIGFPVELIQRSREREVGGILYEVIPKTTSKGRR